MEHEFDPTEHRGFTRAGDYDLLRKMGAGGFGTVFEARHRLTGLPYAVKRIYLSAEDAERFRNEALYPARIASESLHVMGVHSFFHDDTIDAFYLVTELITNGDLRAFLDREPRPLPLQLALEVGIGIAKGLAAIHAQRIVHRDLKPANILMDRKDGQWVAKIADFGLARSVSSVSIAQFATSGYASPEQLDLLSDTPLGPESDLFSYGMVLYELLTGERPTAAQGLRDYGRWLGARQQPPAPSLVRRELATWPVLDRLTAQLLDFDRTTRLASAAEVVRVLDGVLRPVAFPPVTPILGSRPASQPAPTPVPQPPPSPPLPPPVTRPLSTPIDIPSTPRLAPPAAVPEPRWRMRLGMAAVFAVTGTAMYLGLPWESATISPGMPEPLTTIAEGHLDPWFGFASVGLPALFGIALGVAARLGALRVAALALLALLAYNIAVGPAAVVTIPAGWSLATYPAAGGVGAVLMCLALGLVRWQRPTIRQAAMIAGTGLGGGLAFWLLSGHVQPFGLGGSLAYAAWQIPVGLAIVDRADLRSATGGPRLRWWLLIALAILILAHDAGANWRRATLAAVGGAFVYNPIDLKPYVRIPAGEFRMGCSPGDTACASDERPVRTIRFTREFWLSQSEVSVNDWKRVSRQLPPPPIWRGRALNPDWTDGRMPIVNVTWDQARDYCAAVDGRLPTEAEWEYAARAGATGPRDGPLADIAWYADNTGVDPSFRSQTLPGAGYADGIAANRSGMRAIGTRRFNAWRMHDMLGNVAEWVEDDYRETNPEGELTDPPAYTGGVSREASKSVRGGAWYNRPSDVRVSSRDKAEATMRSIVIGFRCVWNRPADAR
jgi:formylglycine-generating enzyme required for sulfatase activity/serine/threonine protein kinase